MSRQPVQVPQDSARRAALASGFEDNLAAVRRGLVLLHRWIGIASAAFLLIVALTGCVLVFYEELDELLNPQLFHPASEAEGNGAARSAGEIVDAALAAVPDSWPYVIELPDAAGQVAHVFLMPQASTASFPLATEVFIDPGSARVLGTRVWGAARLDTAHLLPFIHLFHFSLGAGGSGIWILGAFAVSWLLSQLIGAVIAVPRARLWRRSFRIREGARGVAFLHDLHRATGLWLLPVTLVLAVSAVNFNWTGQTRAVVDAVSPVVPRADERAAPLAQPIFAPPVSVDRALAIAASVTGGARIDRLSLIPYQGLYWIQAFDPRDIDHNGGRNIFVDARSGAVLEDRHATEGSAGNAFLAWQAPLHSGKALGWIGRALVFLGGLGVCLFAVSGLLMWAMKRSQRRGAVRARES